MFIEPLLWATYSSKLLHVLTHITLITTLCGIGIIILPILYIRTTGQMHEIHAKVLALTAPAALTGPHSSCFVQKVIGTIVWKDVRMIILLFALISILAL